MSKRRTRSGSLLNSSLRKQYRVRPVHQAHLRRRGAWPHWSSAQLEGRACDQAKGWGEVPWDRRSTPTVRSSLPASFTWPTSCPLRWSRYSLMLRVTRVGKRSERVTAVLIGAGPTPRPLAPQGRLCFAQESGRQFLPDLPLAARKGSSFAAVPGEAGIKRAPASTKDGESSGDA